MISLSPRIQITPRGPWAEEISWQLRFQKQVHREKYRLKGEEQRVVGYHCFVALDNHQTELICLDDLICRSLDGFR